MTITCGIRDLVRNRDILKYYDYVDIEDKKTHEYKGLFLSPAYAKEFKAYLETKRAQEKNEKLLRLRTYAGKGSIDEKYEGLNVKEIRASIAGERFGE